MTSVEEDEPIYKSIASFVHDDAGIYIHSNAGRMDRKLSELRQPNVPFSSKLYGRLEAQQILIEAYRNSQINDSKWNLVIIQGASGTGKTALVQSLQEELQRTNGSMLRWPGNRQAGLHISPGFHDSLQKWIQNLMKLEKSDLKRFQEQLRQSFDSQQISFLLHQWPLLAPLFPFNHATHNQGQDYRHDWKFFQKFMRAAASSDFPLVYFLDDFQWIEQTSLRWIVEALVDTPIQGALFILAYDSDWETTEIVWQENLKELKTKSNINIIDITLENWDESTLGDWLEDLLGASHGSCDDIIRYIYYHTRGNPLFAKELVEDLTKNSCIALDENNLSWKLKEHQAIEGPEGCSNVSKYLSIRLQSHLPQMLNVLTYAACLGYRFNIKLLSSIVSDSVLPEIKDAVVLGILKPEDDENQISCQKRNENQYVANGGCYHFAHNSMHQAVLLLIGDKERIEYRHLTIARKLLREFETQELKSNLLLVMTHAVKGARWMKVQEKVHFATLSLEASRKAVQLASFEAAKRSIDFAISLLDANSWRDDYELTLAIHNVAAEIAYTGGNYEDVELMVKGVLDNARTLDDKIQAYTTKIYMLGSSNQASKAIKIGLEVLQQMGQQFPLKPKPNHIFSSLIRTRLMLRGKSMEMLLRLPTMTDEHAASAMIIMNIIFPSAFFTDPFLAPLLVMRMIKLSISKGLSPVSCVAFALYGMLLVGNVLSIEDGVQMGNLSLKMLDRFQCKPYVPRVYAAVFGCIHGWTKPLHLALDKLQCGYRIALETGDIEFAVVNISMYIYYLFDSGYPLSFIEQENQTYMKVLPPQHTNSTILKQTRLMETIRKLMSSESEVEIFSSQMPIQVGVNLGETLKIMVAVMFSEYQQALDLGRAFFRTSPYKLYDFAAYYLYLGIANVSLFQLTGRKHLRFLIAARHYRKKVYQICKSTPDYALGKLALMKAEISSTSSRRHDNTILQYMVAISWAKFKNHLFEGAFANERYARYHLSRGDLDSAIKYLRESCTLYREWNAFRKADLLQVELDELESKQSPEPCLRYLTSPVE